MDLPDLRDNELIDDLPSSRDKESVRIVTDNSVLESHAFKALMRKGMANFTFLEKIVFQLQIIFLRKNQAELFRTYYLKELEQEVLASGNFANFETKTLTARFANELFELYKAVSTVKAPLDLLWQNKSLCIPSLPICLRREVQRSSVIWRILFLLISFWQSLSRTIIVMRRYVVIFSRASRVTQTRCLISA